MYEQLQLYPSTTAKYTAIYKASLGQFFTPNEIAEFMCEMFSASNKPVHLLDPGTGQGILAKNFMEKFHDLQAATLIERDATLLPALQVLFKGNSPNTQVINDDFIRLGSSWVSAGKRPFSHVIMNPPYRKIATASNERRFLRHAGIETVNLYSGFAALALALLRPCGELVAIIPRSFCNGPYYRSFRQFIFERSALKQIHLFKSRTSVFSSDNVLQENVIIHLERDGKQGNVIVSFSTDQTFADLHTETYPFDAILDSSSEQHFLKIPENSQTTGFHLAHRGLSELSIQVSTGPVVDFRIKQYLRKLPLEGDAPLLYPAHFNKGFLWPRTDFRKYNSISVCAETRRWLYPTGWYVVTRRLSSKEEKRRIVAYVVNPHDFRDNDYIAFENHFNVFHCDRKGLDENVARGLAAYLNSKRVDEIFRTFSGHTQVNATDLRSLPYPTLEQLALLGKEICSMPPEGIDEWLMKKLN